jgi:pimeloyl-ACP methyl ester carboxylesterase
MLIVWMVASAAVAPVPSCHDGDFMTHDQRLITHYRTVEVDGINVFYREAGPASAPTVLLLHGFPSSSRMYDSLIPQLADRYHVVAPDFPGFGHSDAPPPERFDYTFDHLAEVIDDFTVKLDLRRYTLFMQDYGGPVGFRLALRHPQHIDALVIQNAVAHEDGLGPLWESRRAYWADRDANIDKVRANLLSLAAARQRHVGTSPHPERYNPDTWVDEYAFLSRPGQSAIQEDLFYDYRTNVASYPRWQVYLREKNPALLVLWGRYDPSFMSAEASAYQRDLPRAEVHILDAGHFALDEASEQVGQLTHQFLDSHVSNTYAAMRTIR